MEDGRAESGEPSEACNGKGNIFKKTSTLRNRYGQLDAKPSI